MNTTTMQEIMCSTVGIEGSFHQSNHFGRFHKARFQSTSVRSFRHVRWTQMSTIKTSWSIFLFHKRSAATVPWPSIFISALRLAIKQSSFNYNFILAYDLAKGYHHGSVGNPQLYCMDPAPESRTSGRTLSLFWNWTKAKPGDDCPGAVSLAFYRDKAGRCNWLLSRDPILFLGPYELGSTGHLQVLSFLFLRHRSP